MQLSVAAALLACCTAVRAFSDSSPFIVFSTAELTRIGNRHVQLQTINQLVAAAKEVFSTCPTDRYVVVSIPNLHAADVRDASGSRMPNLKRAVSKGNLKSEFSVAEVIGQVATDPLEQYIKTTCKDSTVERVELRHLPSLKEVEKRAEVLADNDHELGKLLDGLNGEEFTVIIVSDPNQFQAYEPQFAEPVHMDLKRSEPLSAFIGQRANNETRDNRPLFEKYQFFTPGIFMGLLALVLILSILAVGLSALSSLQVSYGAFDKEMGPAAQKKNM
ncbi:BIG/ATPase V1 complex, subunit S1 [Apodospora peruviana]|uniref:Protein BIG1 n=1 Tax=Apodospora peruviana TaxID=516989 RepID=A0AAE0II88_9PEZI|nr:BIG/ATPase V1 complex, subunit S1 [Apodospora peruviana]